MIDVGINGKEETQREGQVVGLANLLRFFVKLLKDCAQDGKHLWVFGINQIGYLTRLELRARRAKMQGGIVQLRGWCGCVRRCPRS